MKLQVRKFNSRDVTYLVLCDETGKMLPGQTGSKYECGVDRIPTITVSIDVIGDVTFVEGDAIPY